MQCDRQQRFALAQLATAFETEDVEFVIPRGHANLPEAFPGSDLDIFVAPSSFDRAMVAVEDAGFSADGSRLENAVGLVREGLSQPSRGIRYMLESPGDLIDYTLRQLDPGRQTRRGLRERHFVNDGLDVHLFNHLAYASPMNGAKIRVDPAVETAFLERRQRGQVGWIPSPPDELLHLICRGVFDYSGHFPGYYVRRCDEIVATLRDDSTADSRFRTLLEPVFFNAASLVHEHVFEGRYDDIRGALFRFADY